MRIYNFILFSILLIGGFACKQEDDNVKGSELDYFIFGHFYGYCVGEGCIEIFKMEGDALFEDSNDFYPGSLEPYDGNYTSLSQQKFELVKDLVDFFPEGLYDEPVNVIGIPDGGDWGGVYVEISHNGGSEKTGFWLLDQMDNNMPQVYNDFVDKVNEKIALINQ